MSLITKELIVKNSRFIGIAIDVNKVDEVDDILEEIKIIYKKATHYCYAYKIGPHEKASDDGEPRGTAALPMLNMIRFKNLDNFLLIVVRYFGGKKLGAGPLMRAYNKISGQTIDLYKGNKNIN